MLRETTKKIHFHIGPDRVFEDLFRQVFEPSSNDMNLFHISSEDYLNYLRVPIDGGFDEEMPGVLHNLCSSAAIIAISRPRLLYDGALMNIKGGGGSFYKLRTIQKGCQGYKLIFHLFLLDHLGYLTRSQPGKLSASSNQFSWLPLVKLIFDQLAEGNELVVWNAESKDFVQDFVSSMTGSSRHLDEPKNRTLRVETSPTPEAEERFASKIGLDAFALDDAFENDLKELQIDGQDASRFMRAKAS